MINILLFKTSLKMRKLPFLFSLCLANFDLSALAIFPDAQSFSPSDQNRKKCQSTDFLNNKIILICLYLDASLGYYTKQAYGYRDDLDEWKFSEFEIVGISEDLPENLSLLQKAEDLKFSLLSDVDGKDCPSLWGPDWQRWIDSKIQPRGKDSPSKGT